MDDKQIMHAMCLDDAYAVERVLARGADGVTELVLLEGAGPFVRKKIAMEHANRGVWGMLADIRCPRLPHVEATYELPDEFVVVYDYVPGTPLQELVGEGGLSEEEILRYACQVCEAAAALHEQGIIHRDIAPKNVIVAGDGAHLIDLGIARFRVEDARRDTSQLGTWGFASPEQYGFAQTDARSDLYSIGRLIGYMLTGVMPGGDDYDNALADSTVVSPTLKAIVDSACAFEPSARYQTARELRDALAAVSGAKGGSGPVSPSARAAGRRYQRLVPVGIAAAVVLVVASAVLVMRPWDRGVDEKNADLAQEVAGQSSSGGSGSGSGSGASSGASSSSGTSSNSSGSSSSSGSAFEDIGKSVGEQIVNEMIGNPSAVTQSTHTVTAEEVGVQDLQITESNWFVLTRHGYSMLHYCAAVKNPNVGWRTAAPELKVVGRNSEGKVIFSYSTFMPRAHAGQTVYMGDVAGVSETPATVDFSVDSRNWIASDLTGNAIEVKDPLDHKGNVSATFTGEQVLKEDLSQYEDNIGSLHACVALRDSNGKLIDVATGWVDIPTAGAPDPFQIYGDSDVSYSTFEIYVYAD